MHYLTLINRYKKPYFRKYKNFHLLISLFNNIMKKRLHLKNRFLTLEIRYLAEINGNNYFARLRTSIKIHLLNTVLNKIGKYIISTLYFLNI